MLRPCNTLVVVSSLPPRLAPLQELAYNLWWTWNMDAIDLFRRLDRDLWETSGHNPVLMIGKIPQQRLEDTAKDEGFVSHLMRVYQTLNRYMGSPETWFRRNHAAKYPNLNIAYFSFEYGITECLPIYSGGLGVLAGDLLKSASDLGLPLVGVGILYQEGYFRQYLNADGWQQESYPVNSFHNMPVQLERGGDGSPVTVQVDIAGRTVTAQVWYAQIGRVRLYLLDTNLEVNSPEDRDITDRLYGGDQDMRIRQEIVLGIGGVRALRALGIDPTICHINEGHSAFLTLERIRMAMQERHLDFAEARELTSAGNIFTTHTSVPAGIDLFPPYLIDRYFSGYWPQLGISRDEFLRLGRGLQERPEDNFSMAILALTLAAKTNAVSQLHGDVARRMWQYLWPQTPASEVPIISISNGIHSRSWLSSDMSSLLLRYLGPRWIDNPDDQSVWQYVERIPDEELWRTHERRRERMVANARERLRTQLERRGATPKDVAEAAEVLDPDILTIGFGRRFATYKRATLLFTDLERLSKILNNRAMPVQIIFSGKAHPHDNPGKEYIRQIVHLARRDDLRRRVVFLEDYDLALARYLVQGVDVWLNTPRRGLEASGTSGMKVAANGGINLSTFDGWWCAGYSSETGWRIGHGEAYDDERYGDEVEAKALYDLLEKDIVPLFYARGADGLPRGWITKMKRSMGRIGPVFSTHCMVQDYAEKLYWPAIQRATRLAASDCVAAKALAHWLQLVRQHWGEVRILEVTSNAHPEMPVQAEIKVQAQIALGALEPRDVLVQLFHGPVDARGEITDYELVEMESLGRIDDGPYAYVGAIACARTGLYGYAMRALPNHPDLKDVHVPGLVVWSS